MLSLRECYYAAVIGIALGLLVNGIKAASAHGGSIDSLDGHVDTETGEYHCHSELCENIQHERRMMELELEDYQAAIQYLEDRLREVSRCVTEVTEEVTLP